MSWVAGMVRVIRRGSRGFAMGLGYGHFLRAREVGGGLRVQVVCMIAG